MKNYYQIVINLQHVSEKDVMEKFKHYSKSYVLKTLPKYCLRDNGSTAETEYHHQYTFWKCEETSEVFPIYSESQKQKYILFDVDYVEEEIRDDFDMLYFDDIDFSFLKGIDWNGAVTLIFEYEVTGTGTWLHADYFDEIEASLFLCGYFTGLDLVKFENKIQWF